MTLADDASNRQHAHTPADSVSVNVMPHLRPAPEFLFEINKSTGGLDLTYQGGTIASVGYNLATLHTLPELVEGKDDFINGIALRIAEKELLSPLGFETLLQVTMLNMAACVFPRRNWTAPLRENLPMHSMDAEINFIRNTSDYHLYNHVHCLQNIAKGKPVLLALPGPSLDLDFIREHGDSFVVLAAGRAAGIMLEAGVAPDFAYIQDVNSPAWNVNFSGLGDKRFHTALICNPLGGVWKYAKHFSRVFKAWNLYGFELDVFPRIKEIPPSSVGGAYSLARLFGASSIYLIGNDCGDTVAPPEPTALPEALTNLAYERDGQMLTFTPTTYEMDLRFHYGDEISVTTKSEYITGAQWLKSRVTVDAVSAGVKVYDQSQTKLTQFNSAIEDGSTYTIEGPVSLPELPSYTMQYNVRKFLMTRKNSYSFILRKLENGVIPNMAYTRPFSSIFCNTTMAEHDSLEPQQDDLQIAKANTERLLEHVDIALSLLG